MSNEWVQIHSGIDYIKTEMIKQLLNNNEIDAVILNQKDSSYHVFGTIKLFAQKNDQKRALELISEFENENEN